MSPFRFRDPLIRKWVKARYKAERHGLIARYAEWEIIGEPELRWPQEGWFSPWKRTARGAYEPGG